MPLSEVHYPGPQFSFQQSLTSLMVPGNKLNPHARKSPGGPLPQPCLGKRPRTTIQPGLYTVISSGLSSAKDLGPAVGLAPNLTLNSTCSLCASLEVKSCLTSPGNSQILKGSLQKMMLMLRAGQWRRLAVGLRPHTVTGILGPSQLTPRASSEEPSPCLRSGHCTDV